MDLSKAHIEQIFNSTLLGEHLSETILVQCMKNEETANVVIKTLNRALSKSQSNAFLKARALDYMQIVLPHSSKTTLQENFLVWINFCLSKEKLTSFRFKILGMIIDLCGNYDELHKEIAKNYIPKIITACLEAQTKRAESVDVLICLKKCLTKYSCSYYSKQIETLLLSYLHEKLPMNVVKEASECFHYLQQVGFPGLNNKNYSTNWSNQMDKLCATVHNLYNVFFQETESFTAPSEGFELPGVPVDFNEIQRLHLYLSQLTNCIIFMKTLLETKFNAPKDVHPHNILWVVQRGFLEHQCIGKINSLMMAHHSILVNRLQTNLLFLLRSLLACLGHHILIFSFDITKIFMDCILVMETCECLQTDMKFQKTFYTVLNFWLPIVKNQMNNTYQNKLLKFFIARLQPVKQEVTLSLSQNNHKSKKARTKAITEKTIASLKQSCTSESSAKETQMEHTCNYILDSLKQFLICVHLNVKSETLKELYSLLTTLASDIQTNEAVHPYTNEICQQKVHEVLVSLFEQPNLIVPPPLKLCLKLLVNGQNLQHISYVCKRGLNTLEKIAQPVCPSLYIRHDDRKEITEENHDDGNKINILDVRIISPAANDVRKTKDVGEGAENDVIVTEIEDDICGGELDEIDTKNGDRIEDDSVILMETDEEVQSHGNIVDDRVEDNENSVIEINNSIIVEDNETEEEKLEVITIDVHSPPTKESKNTKETDDCDLQDAMNSFVDEINDY